MDYDELDAVRYALHRYRENMSEAGEDTRKSYDVEMLIKVNTHTRASDYNDAYAFVKECLEDEIHMDLDILSVNVRESDV